MKIDDGCLTILINDDSVSISIKDNKANTTFVEIKLTPEKFCAALSRLCDVPCKEMEVYNLDRIGKKHENKTFEFELGITGYNTNRETIAKKQVLKLCPEGWIPDLYFRSQGSFFEKDGRGMARTIIRRWV